jgi:hypothetical protein
LCWKRRKVEDKAYYYMSSDLEFPCGYSLVAQEVPVCRDMWELLYRPFVGASDRE